MSPKRGGGFQPSEGPPRFTLDEYQAIGDHFKNWFESTHLKWWIIAAGVGAIIEGIHVIWLFIFWLSGRVR